MIVIRCACGVTVTETDRIRAILKGVLCWYCGRLWRYDRSRGAITIQSGPTTAVTTVNDPDAGGTV